MNNIIKKYIGKSSLMMAFALMATGAAMTSCSDDTLSNINTDKTKVNELDPNAQLTTALLQTYGDFSLMDTYRNYISGFPQYFAGGWNVTNYAGSNFREDDMSRRVWDRYYEISIKNLVDAIHNSADKANLNAALRIHRVYLTAVLADTYGDVPCSEAGLGYISGCSFQTIERADGEVHIDQLGLEQLAHVQYFLIKFFILEVGGIVNRDFLVREEHEVIDENLGGLLKSFLRLDGTVRSDFEHELVVVSLLFDTIRLNCAARRRRWCPPGPG